MMILRFRCRYAPPTIYRHLSSLTSTAATVVEAEKASITAVSSSSLSSLSLSSSSKYDDKKYRLDVAIVGAPNAGKSQLLNVLTESTVAAVSRKRHTTRHGILGAKTVLEGGADGSKGPTQLVFVDTPGYMSVSRGRGDGGNVEKVGADLSLLTAAPQEMKTTDYTLLVVDSARKLTDGYKETIVSLMLHALHAQGRDKDGDDDDDDDDDDQETQEKFGIVLNKVDLVKPKTDLLELTDELATVAEACIDHCLNESPPEIEDGNNDEEYLLTLKEQLFPSIFYVSALHEDGIDDLMKHLLKMATPSQEWPLSPTDVTTLSPLERVQEIIREKLYRCLHREVPHQIEQVNRVMETNDGVLVIHQDLVVQTKSHHKLVRGSGNQTLKRIQDTAQRDIARTFPKFKKVSLLLNVRLKKSQHEQPLDGGRGTTHLGYY